MLLVTKTEEADKKTKSGLVISAAFNDSGLHNHHLRNKIDSISSI